MSELTLARLNYLFEIDIERGRFVWRNPPLNHSEKRGQEAGCVQVRKTPYWVIQIDGAPYRRGRLLFFVAHGRWPVPCVDHANRNSLDDRLVNLREATHAENARNHSPHRRRIRLPTGVRTNHKTMRYEARITFNKKQIHLGGFDTPEEASAAYQMKRRELYGQFA